MLQLAEDMAEMGGSWVRLMVTLTLSVVRYIVNLNYICTVYLLCTTYLHYIYNT